MDRKAFFAFLLFCGVIYAPFSYADGVLGVTGISSEKTYAQAGGGYASGWKWTLSVTVPDNEPILQLKFGNWANARSSFSPAGNVRFYSAQSSNAATEDSALSITRADTYSGSLNLLPNTAAARDVSTTTPGRQIEITVETKIPIESVGGSYAGSFGIITNPDTTAPVITLLGSPSVTIERGTPYADAGATATDNIDSIVSANISLSGAVTVASVGTYILSYNVYDAAGNAATPVTRTVLVQDTIAPTGTVSYSATMPTNTDVIATLTPSEPVTFLNTGGMATTTDGTATTTFAQNGSFTFLFADVANNTGSTTASVSNIDKEAPTITNFSLNGTENDLSVNIASTSVSLAITASEPVNWLSVKIEKQSDASIYKLFHSGAGCTDGGTACAKTWAGDLSSAGTAAPDGAYRIKVRMQDAAGNVFDDYLGKIITIDTTAPVITIGGNSTVAQDFGVAYTDAGATANDARDGVVSVASSGSVDVNTEGDYAIIYTAVDALGNAASATRTVQVRKVPVTSIMVTGPGGATQDLVVHFGSTMQISATIAPVNATNQNYVLDVYKLQGDNGTATIDQNGLLHGIYGNDGYGGRVRVRATAADGSGKFGEVQVYVWP